MNLCIVLDSLSKWSSSKNAITMVVFRESTQNLIVLYSFQFHSESSQIPLKSIWQWMYLCKQLLSLFLTIFAYNGHSCLLWFLFLSLSLGKNQVQFNELKKAKDFVSCWLILLLEWYKISVWLECKCFLRILSVVFFRCHFVASHSFVLCLWIVIHVRPSIQSQTVLMLLKAQFCILMGVWLSICF